MHQIEIVVAKYVYFLVAKFIICLITHKSLNENEIKYYTHIVKLVVKEFRQHDISIFLF